jgi:hypothetical protein
MVVPATVLVLATSCSAADSTGTAGDSTPTPAATSAEPAATTVPNAATQSTPGTAPDEVDAGRLGPAVCPLSRWIRLWDSRTLPNATNPAGVPHSVGVELESVPATTRLDALRIDIVPLPRDGTTPLAIGGPQIGGGHEPHVARLVATHPRPGRFEVSVPSGPRRPPRGRYEVVAVVTESVQDSCLDGRQPSGPPDRGFDSQFLVATITIT